MELQPDQTLKSYDIRVGYDPTQVTIQRNQIQQGAWFLAGGPTFFWHNIIDNELVVNGAILGQGLHVTGSGVVFRVPVLLLAPALVDLEAGTHMLFDANAQLLPSLAIPAALQTPCTSFGLSIDYEVEEDQIRLNWDPQEWTQAYLIFAREDWNQPWLQVDSTTSTTWTSPVSPQQRLYQVRAQFVSSR